jgi:hypothetical protein
MLDPALQDGKKIPKWDSQAHQGIFVGFSHEHTSLVPLIFNPCTQQLSPQYHVIIDDAFSTVPSLYSIEEWGRRFEELFHTSWECFLPADADSVRPPLDDEWLSPDEFTQRHHVPASSMGPLVFGPLSLVPTQPPVPLPVVPEGAVLPEPHQSSVDTGADAANLPRFPPPIHLLDLPPLIHTILHVFGLELGEMDLPLIDLILSVVDVGLLVLFHVFSLLPSMCFQLLLLGVSLLSLLLTLALPVVLSTLPFVSDILILQI